jgi:hypothetical protein
MRGNTVNKEKENWDETKIDMNIVRESLKKDSINILLVFYSLLNYADFQSQLFWMYFGLFTS